MTADRLQQAEIRGPEPVARLVEGLSLGNVLADRADVTALGDGRKDLDLGIAVVGCLDLHDGVGAVGDDTAGVDGNGRAGPAVGSAVEGVEDDRAGIGGADGIGRAHGVAVHRRPLVVRHRVRGRELGRHDAAVGQGERQAFRPVVWRDRRQQLLAGGRQAGPVFEPRLASILCRHGVACRAGLISRPLWTQPRPRGFSTSRRYIRYAITA